MENYFLWASGMSVAMINYHGQGNLQKEEFVPMDQRVKRLSQRQQVGMATGEGRRGRKLTYHVLNFMQGIRDYIIFILPPVTKLLQQNCTT